MIRASCQDRRDRGLELRVEGLTSARGSSRPTRLVGLLFAALVACVIAPACSAHGERSDAFSASDAPLELLEDLRRRSDAAAWRDLARRAIEESARPGMLREDIPSAPGIGERVQAEGEGLDAELASLPLDAVLSRVGESGPDLPSLPEPVDGASDGSAALRAYAEGRSALLDGDAARAERELERATELDPSSPEPWGALAQAQLALGRQDAAFEYLRVAIAAGLEDPRVFELVAREAIESDRHAEAAWYLGRALALDPGMTDPVLELIIEFELAWSLQQVGYSTAALELARGWRDSPIPPGIPSQFTDHFNALARLEPQFWLRLGDAASEAGRPVAAIDAYCSAAASLEELPGAVIPRLVTAALRAGRPAQGVVFAIAPVVKPGPQLSQSRLELIGYASEHSGLSREIVGVLREIGRADEQATPTLESRLARAMAAADRDRAGSILSDHLRDHGKDVAAIRDMVSVGSRAPADVLDRGVRALSPDALNSGLVADQMLSIGVAGDDLVEAARGVGSPPGKLLGVRLLERLRRHEEARVLLDSVEGSDLMGVDVARVEVSAGLGDWEGAEAALASIRGLESPAARRAEAAALRALQRFDAASEVLSAHARSAPGSARAASEAGRMALARGKVEDAETWLDRALALDPYDEGARELLISIWMPTGPAPDQPRLEASLRTLREIAPRGALLRWITAQQLLRQGLAVEAERRLVELASDFPTDDRVVDALTQAWVRQGRLGDSEALERGRRWLEERESERPASVGATLALGRVIMEQGRPSLALDALNERYAELPARELAVARERLLREALDEPEQAARLQEERLAASPPTIDNTIERALVRAREGRPGEAINALEELPDCELTAEQGAGLLETVELLATSPQEPGIERAWRAMAQASRFGLRVPPEVHQALLTQLAQSPAAGVEDLARAVGLTEEQHPELGSAAVELVARARSEAGRPEDALLLLARWSEGGEHPEIDVGLAAVWCVIVGQRGGPSELRVLFERAEPEVIEGALAALISPEFAARASSASAELAYALAGEAYRGGRKEDALGLYRLAIERQPDHAGANNDLAYFLTEAGEGLDEAESMLEIALRAEPMNANFLDSLGWLRYKRGVFEDARGEGDDLMRLGAVSLLRRAAGLPLGQSNATIQDHLGDALWRVGARDEAAARWEQAHRLLVEQLNSRAALETPEALLREQRERRDALRQKTIDFREGRAPEIAPLLDGGDDAADPDNHD